MLSKPLSTVSVLLLSLQAVTALPVASPTSGSPKGVIVVSSHGTGIGIGSRTAQPHSEREAEADAEAEAEALPGGSAWGGR